MLINVKQSKHYDTKGLLDKIDLAGMLVDMGFEDVDPEAESQLLYCIFHNDSGTKSFSVNLDKKVFHCFSGACGVKGSAISLYALWKNVSYDEATQQIQYLPSRRDVDVLHKRIQGIAHPMSVSEKIKILKEFLALTIPVEQSPLLPYLTQRGLTLDTLRRGDVRYLNPESLKTALSTGAINRDLLFRVGLLNVWGKSPFESHKILFPFKMGGDPVFIQGRLTDGDETRSKYLGLRGTVPCLWNHGALFTSPGKVYLTEGVMDSISLEQMGYGPSLGIVGTEGFKTSWYDDFRSVQEVVIATDHDAAGEAAFLALGGVFASKGKTVSRFPFPAQYKDVNAFLMGVSNV